MPIYGIIGGVPVAALQWKQYRFPMAEHSIEIYGKLVAVTFSARYSCGVVMIESSDFRMARMLLAHSMR